MYLLTSYINIIMIHDPYGSMFLESLTMEESFLMPDKFSMCISN